MTQKWPNNDQKMTQILIQKWPKNDQKMTQRLIQKWSKMSRKWPKMTQKWPRNDPKLILHDLTMGTERQLLTNADSMAIPVPPIPAIIITTIESNELIIELLGWIDFPFLFLSLFGVFSIGNCPMRLSMEMRLWMEMRWPPDRMAVESVWGCGWRPPGGAGVDRTDGGAGKWSVGTDAIAIFFSLSLFGIVNESGLRNANHESIPRLVFMAATLPLRPIIEEFVVFSMAPSIGFWLRWNWRNWWNWFP